MVRIASFDIGRCNFAQYIEDISDDDIISSLKERYSALPKKEQRRVKGAMNENISDILNKVALSGKRVSFLKEPSSFLKFLANSIRSSISCLDKSLIDRRLLFI